MSLPPGPSFPAAACRAPGVDPLWFFPKRGQPVDRAREICAACPHQLDCAEWAILAGWDLYGVWGGLSEKGRRRARRARRALAPVLTVEDDRSMAALEIIAPSTNGHAAAELESVVESARKCRGCDQPIAGSATRQWCSEECRRAHRNEAGTRRRAPGTTPAPMAPGSFAALVGALERAGAEVAVLSVRFADQSWTLTRSTNGRNP